MTKGPFDPLSGTAFEFLAAYERQDAFFRTLYPNGILGAADEAMRQFDEHVRFLKSLGIDGITDAARRAADIALTLELPDLLSPYRLPYEDLTARFSLLGSSDLLTDRNALAFLNNAAALADAYGDFTSASVAMAEATRAFDEWSGFTGSLSEYRNLLDVSGLRLPRIPNVRLLSRAEKRRRLRARLTDNAEPRHVRKAKSLVHGYERTMREIFDGVMADAYGEDWAIERLPVCGCKDLLGRWRNRGPVLNYADYAHYERLVTDPEHFERVFARGFEDREETGRLFRYAGELRAASHHGREFTVDDLKALTLTWRTIEKGLLALMDDYAIDY